MTTDWQQIVICLMTLALTLSINYHWAANFSGKKISPEVHSIRNLSALKLLFSVFHVLLQMVHWRLVGVQQDLWWRDAHKSRALHQEDWTIWGGNTGLQWLSNTPANGERVLQQPVMSTSVGSFGLVWSKEIWSCMFWDVLVINTKAFTV